MADINDILVVVNKLAKNILFRPISEAIGGKNSK
jgi:hypothetical protein